MKPVMQTRFGAEDGNCYTACLASVLEIALEDLPSFRARPGESEPEIGLRWNTAHQEWMGSRGLRQIVVRCASDLGDAIVIAGGKGPRGLPHSVVWQGGRCIHDPHPDGGGLVGAPEDYTILFPLNPATLLQRLGGPQ